MRTLTLIQVLAITLVGTAAINADVAGAASPAVPVTLFPSDASGARLPGPAYWTETVSPGKTLHLYATVGNPGKAKASIRLLPADALTAEFGGLDYSLAGRPLTAAGKWVRLTKTRYTIQPGKGFVIPITVHVPRTLKPGQYVAGIVASPPASGRSSGSVGIQVQVRVAIPIVMTVPGRQVRKFALRHVDVNRQSNATDLILRLTNRGNVLLKGTGHLWVWRRGLKSAVVSARVNPGTSIPHQTFQYPVVLGPHPVATTYTYKLSLAWKGGRIAAHGSFVIRSIGR